MRGKPLSYSRYVIWPLSAGTGFDFITCAQSGFYPRDGVRGQIIGDPCAL